MKLSSAAITVATISLLSSAHAAPLALKNGEITARPHHRRGSDLSDLDLSSSSRASEALEDLDIGFEPGSHLILPRILNFIKRQVTNGAATLTGSNSESSTTESTGSTADDTDRTSGTTDQDAHTFLMSPDYESYGFASETGPGTALAPVREIKE